jgi:hypothetical protein
MKMVVALIAPTVLRNRIFHVIASIYGEKCINRSDAFVTF